ncbi:MAG TPA: zf-HC2 domain-containing protein [Polyangia bacterium]|jgi:anti-sigma factor (TIGR02949 family)|nr:zf-HC2 domain-containing protein [Polyangia bacterium]
MTQAFRCNEVDQVVDAFVDGEFAAEDRTAMEQHLVGCTGCARRLRSHAAIKAAVKEALPRPAPPPELERRVRSALAEAVAQSPGARARRLLWVALPAAAAAFVIGVATTYQGPCPVTEEAIATYRKMPVEVVGTDAEVRAWFSNKVDFAVRPPRLPQAELVGGRLANVGGRQAAYLVYDMGGDKVGVFLFDPRDLPIEGSRHARVGNREIYLDAQRGYHVAAFRDQDLGYVFTSDIDENRMLELVSSTVRR